MEFIEKRITKGISKHWNLSVPQKMDQDIFAFDFTVVTRIEVMYNKNVSIVTYIMIGEAA